MNMFVQMHSKKECLKGLLLFGSQRNINNSISWKLFCWFNGFCWNGFPVNLLAVYLNRTKQGKNIPWGFGVNYYNLRIKCSTKTINIDCCTRVTYSGENVENIFCLISYHVSALVLIWFRLFFLTQCGLFSQPEANFNDPCSSLDIYSKVLYPTVVKLLFAHCLPTFNS